MIYSEKFKYLLLNLKEVARGRWVINSSFSDKGIKVCFLTQYCLKCDPLPGPNFLFLIGVPPVVVKRGAWGRIKHSFNLLGYK